jgi:antitoxin VapB
VAIAKVFKSGNSQAIRLPKEFRLSVKEVELIRQGDDIVIRQPAPRSFASALAALAAMPGDFLVDGLEDPPPQERDWEL